eukprot:jgi/Chrpa1/5710/Chrysochromulina_OHIO_Genome00014185-RA
MPSNVSGHPRGGDTQLLQVNSCSAEYAGAGATIIQPPGGGGSTQSSPGPRETISVCALCSPGTMAVCGGGSGSIGSSCGGLGGGTFCCFFSSLHA